MKEKCRMYGELTGKNAGKRVVYYGPVNELGDADLYYLDRKREKMPLCLFGLAVHPADEKKIIQE